jgi:hypothetical protein
MGLDYFYQQCNDLAKLLDSKRSQFHKLLAPYETFEVIEHEIHSAIEALENASVEYEGFEHPQGKVTASCFLPVNLPLYSLVLYAVLPAYYFETVYLRPGVSLSKYVPELIKLMELERLGFDQIKVKDLPAKLFVDLYAKDSDVILFTGKYSNALMLERECPESMIEFEGTGPCPFFVFEDADVDLAVDKAVNMRCFNSGQDCVAPDVMFVHKSKIDEFQNKLQASLDQIKVGDSRDKSVRITLSKKNTYLASSSG